MQDGWTEISARIRQKLAGLPREKMGWHAIIAAYEYSDFEKMEEIRARADEIVDDEETAQLLKAWYRQMCKRPCFHDRYLQAFNAPSTRLIDTDGKGVERITERGLRYAAESNLTAIGHLMPVG